MKETFCTITGIIGGFIAALVKKFCILLMIVVAVRVDILLGTTYIRDAMCIAFCMNELLSIVENTSLMDIPYPPQIKKAIDVLQEKVGRIDENSEVKNDVNLQD